MAKISELTEWATPIATDTLPIVDVTAGITKKVTLANLLGKMPVGSVTAPTLAFTGDPNSGQYWIAADNLGFACGGVKALDLQAAQVGVPDGTVGQPGLGFYSDTNNGVYRIGADNYAFAVGGVKALEFTTTQIAVRDGTVAAPGLASISDLDTGVYWPAANRIGIAVNGAQLIDFGVTGMKIGGTATRAGTAGTNAIHIFDGVAPTSTLANGCSIYSTTGELYTQDAAGNATLQTPHDDANFWIFRSKNTVTGKVLKIDMEKLMRRLNYEFGGGFIEEYIQKEK